MWLYCSVNENVWGNDELLSSWDFIGPPTSLWRWGSPRHQLDGAVNHQTEPVSPMLSRLTVLVWDMYFPLLGEQKRGSAARPPEVKGKLALRTLHLLLCFPSVHLSGRRQTMALSGRWMEVVDERWRQKEQESKRESEGEMYGSPHCLRQNDRWGDYGAGLLSTVIKVREPSCTTQVDSRPIAQVERVQIQEAGNALHFNAIFHSIGQNSLLHSFYFSTYLFTAMQCFNWYFHLLKWKCFLTIGGIFHSTSRCMEWAISPVSADSFSLLILSVRVHLKDTHINIETVLTLNFIPLLPSNPMHI